MSIRNGTGRGSWGVGEKRRFFRQGTLDFRCRFQSPLCPISWPSKRQIGCIDVHSEPEGTWNEAQRFDRVRHAFVHTKGSCLAGEGSLSPISAPVDISRHSTRANGAAKQSCRAKQAHRLVQQGLLRMSGTWRPWQMCHQQKFSL